MSAKHRRLARWSKAINNSAAKHERYLKDGFQRSIIQAALDAPVHVDLKALTWFFGLPGLAENSKFQEFVADIPGDIIIHLMSDPVKPGSYVFRDHLLALLRSCTPGAVGLGEDVRRRRLLVCLNAIHHVAKASTPLYPSEFVISDLRTNFANIRIMRPLWNDTDPSIRIISRSICALLARRLLRKYSLERSELKWLENVMGKPLNPTFTNSTGVDSMNLDAYVYGVLSRQIDDLSIQQATSFMATLTILTNSGSDVVVHRSVVEAGISALIRRADERDVHLREVVGPLRRIFEKVFTDPTPDLLVFNISN